ncbi:MAG TPA: hypothetical protein VFW66_15435 [Gemmatimonadales bacterium]|nr:hypothetical protein [Gemmatimonadales bacterium]
MAQVTAVAWPGQTRLAIALATEAARPHDWPGLGTLSPGPLSLIIVPDQARLDSLTQGRAPAWGVGLAVPDTRTIMLRADDDEVRRTLRHELAHLALHARVRERVPLWFDEGYAAWAAGEWERLGGLQLNLAVARGAVPDFGALDAALRGSAQAADAAYALAMSAVLELARRNPSGTLAPLFDRLVRGVDFGDAVRETTGLSLDRFEEAWQQSVRHHYTVVTWIVAGGGWGVLALLVLWFGRWRRALDRPRRAALDEGWIVPDESSELDPDKNR